MREGVLESFFKAAMILFFIFDPFASLPLYLYVSKDHEPEERVRSANRAVLVTTPFSSSSLS